MEEKKGTTKERNLERKQRERGGGGKPREIRTEWFKILEEEDMMTLKSLL